MDPFADNRHPAAGTNDDDQAVPLARRGARTATIAALAVLALGVGAGGYLLGTQLGGDSGDDGTAAPRQPSSGPAPTDRAQPGGEAALTEDPDHLGADDWIGAGEASSEEGVGWFSYSAEGYSPYLTDVLVAGDGLSTDSPGTAEISSSRLADGTPTEVVNQTVEALGLSGELNSDSDTYAWWDGVVDGQSASIAASSDAGGYLDLYISDPTLEQCWWDMEPLPYDLGEDGEAVTGSSGLDDGGVATDAPEDSMPVPEGTCEGEELTVAEARAAAEVFLAAIGRDAAPITWTDQPDAPESAVLHWISGTIDGGHVTFEVSADTVISMNLELPTVQDSLGEYPLASPREAVERFHDPRFQSIYLDSDRVYDGAQYQTWESEEPMQIPQINPGDPIPAWVNEVVITDTELIEATLYAGERGYTVPGYLLTGAQGELWVTIALADEAFDFGG